MSIVLIDYKDKYIRIGLLEDGQLIEIAVEDRENYSSVGRIYAAVVKNILPNQFAFVDIGQERNAFLMLNDSKEFALYKEGKLGIKQGQQILVQVVKEGVSEKGAAVTTQLSFASKDLILLYGADGEIGVSKKIEDKQERTRLKEIAKSMLPEGYGLIMRTSSRMCTHEELSAQCGELLELCRKVTNQGRYIKAPATVYQEKHVLHKILQDFSAGLEKIILNAPEELEKIKAIAVELGLPEESVLLHSNNNSLFSDYFVEKQFEKAIQKKIWLKSGGFIIIEQTEACVVIDVNSGKFSDGKSQQKTAIKTNLEAASEIAKQIRLRNLSGIIIIDFIDLRHSSEQLRLKGQLEKELKKDRLHVNIVGMTGLGLMQLTRKKTRGPLHEYVQCTCTKCGGSGKLAKL